MKSLMMLLVLASAVVHAEETCESKVADQLNLGKAHVTGVRLTHDGAKFQIYHVRTNEWGGEAMTEAVVRVEGCKVIDSALVWAE